MNLVYANKSGDIFFHPYYRVPGRTGLRFRAPREEEMIPLPAGATLVLIPDSKPLILTPRGGLRVWNESNGWAVAALLPQGYVRTLLPAYRRLPSKGYLPLFGYTMVAHKNGRLFVAAQKITEPATWDPCHYRSTTIKRAVKQRLQAEPDNRLLAHLARCALNYRCFTAANIFMRRWEGGLPVSRFCNARCLGCISNQEAECCPAPQKRISFTPTVEEITAIMESHLRAGAQNIISFGQGCEGEPLLRAELIGEAILRVRRSVNQGIININTNGSRPQEVYRLVQAGLNAMRISLISARPDVYRAYYRPQAYSLEDVVQSIKIAVGAGVKVALNLLVIPGLTDQPEEIAALLEFIHRTRVDYVQMRNLNIDPDLLFSHLSPAGQAEGVTSLIARLQKEGGVTLAGYTLPELKK